MAPNATRTIDEACVFIVDLIAKTPFERHKEWNGNFLLDGEVLDFWKKFSKEKIL